MKVTTCIDNEVMVGGGSSDISEDGYLDISEGGSMAGSESGP